MIYWQNGTSKGHFRWKIRRPLEIPGILRAVRSGKHGNTAVSVYLSLAVLSFAKLRNHFREPQDGSPCSRHHGFDFNFGQLSSSARYSPAFLCCHSPVMNRINLPLVRGLFKRVTSVLRPLSKSTSPETSRPCNARGISLLYAKRGKPRKPISFRPFGEVVNAGCLRPPFPEDRVTRDSLYAPTRSTGVTWCTFHWRSLSQ